METSTRKKIRMAMVEKDINGPKIALRVGVSRSAINKTMNGKRKSLKLRKAIANALDLNMADLWPEESK